jgi:alkylation response protein AidB-like acyl-CoA dehydrogenase
MADGVFSFAIVPVADLSIERTWHMAGMRGAGSHTLLADGVVVPAARVTAAADAFTARDLLLYRLTVLGPVVGAARGALDTVDATFASGRKPSMTSYSRNSESPGTRHWLAEATRLVNRAETTMLTVARIVDSAELPEIDEPRRNLELADAAHDCRAAVERMLDLHGASGFDRENELQRFWRDVAVGSRHHHLNPYLATEAYGTALAGRF